MENRENGSPRNNNLLLSASIIAFFLIIAVSLVIQFWPENSPTQTASVTLPGPTKSIMDPATPSKGPSLTLSPAPVLNTETAVTPLPPFPTPFIGTEAPDGFKVLQWREDYVPCDKNRKHPTVNITGVIISGGASSYEITFWQLGNEVITRFWEITTPTTFSPPNSDNSPEQIVVFDEPVAVKKGSYVHVVITFHSADGKQLTWIDDLLYSRKPSQCPGD